MKNIFRLLTVVSLAGLFCVGCQKDNEENVDELKAGVNQIYYDGTIYNVIAADCRNNGDFYIIHAMLENDSINLGIDLNAPSIGVKEDVTKMFSNEEAHSLMFFIGNYQIQQDRGSGVIWGVIGDEEYNNTSIFSKGTETFNYSNGTYTYVLDGTLKNGKQLCINLKGNVLTN